MASRKTTGPQGTQPRPASASNNLSGNYDKIIARTDKAGQTTPFLGQVGKEFAQTTGGTGEAIAGAFTGDGDRFKAGAKQVGEGIISAFTGGPLRGLNNPPPQQFIGGSAEGLAQRQDMYQQGIGQGNQVMLNGLGTSQMGVNTLGQAGAQTGQDRAAAYGLMGTGYGLGGQGVAGQQLAVQQARQFAGQDAGALARLQLQAGLDQTQQAMTAQAAGARGGNQAAAMRNAQAQGSQMALQTNQQAAMMQAAEQQARIQRMMQAEQMAAGVGGQQAGLGYGMAGQGLGAAQGSTQQLAGVGSQMASAGLGQANVGLGEQSQYLNALTETDKAQLTADTQHASAAQAAKGGVMGTVGKAIGGLFGG